MATIAVLFVAVVVLVFVFYWSGRYGDRRRGSGASLRRGPNAHTTSRGQPKKAYTTRGEAAAGARLLTVRDGAPMSIYRCGTCSKWHVGHEK